MIGCMYSVVELCTRISSANKKACHGCGGTNERLAFLLWYYLVLSSRFVGSSTSQARYGGMTADKICDGGSREVRVVLM